MFRRRRNLIKILSILFLLLWAASASLQTNKLNIYSTVCVEFVALTNEVYTLWLSPDLTDTNNWHPHPFYDGYTPNENERVSYWASEDAARGFFFLQVGSGSPSFVNASERTVATNTVTKPPPPPNGL